MSPWLGVTNLTSEKWREELGSESSRRARGRWHGGKGKGTRIVRGWHGATFYLAHQSNINELMTSQGGTHQYLATLRSATTWCQMSESIAGGRVLSPTINSSVKTMGEKKEQTFAYNCQHVTMIDLTQYQETQLDKRRKVAV